MCERRREPFMSLSVMPRTIQWGWKLSVHDDGGLSSHLGQMSVIPVKSWFRWKSFHPGFGRKAADQASLQSVGLVDDCKELFLLPRQKKALPASVWPSNLRTSLPRISHFSYGKGLCALKNNTERNLSPSHEGAEAPVLLHSCLHSCQGHNCHCWAVLELAALEVRQDCLSLLLWGPCHFSTMLSPSWSLIFTFENVLRRARAVSMMRLLLSPLTRSKFGSSSHLACRMVSQMFGLCGFVQVICHHCRTPDIFFHCCLTQLNVG